MMHYDIVIIGAGCSGLSLAYEMVKQQKLDQKIIIIDSKKEFVKDRTWSFWKICEHNFEDCLEKQWSKISVQLNRNTKTLDQFQYPYQTINSLKFYEKVKDFVQDKIEIKLDCKVESINQDNGNFEIKTHLGNISSKYILDTRSPKLETGQLYQHFYGMEIETEDQVFDEEIVNLMDFDCDQKDGVHFFYTLPFSKNKVLIETTWLSNIGHLDKNAYIKELKNYILDRFPRAKNYKIIREEIGAIPMFRRQVSNQKNYYDLGLRGNVNRMSTGYAFPYIQEQSQRIAKNLPHLSIISPISSKYELLDRLFVKGLQNNFGKRPSIFFDIFQSSYQNEVIRFLSSKGTLSDDLQVILKMPKLLFLKNLI